MEIISTGEAVDIIDLGDIAAPKAPELPEGLLEELEVSDIPGAVMLIVPETAEAVKETDWENDGAHEKFLSHLEAKIDKIPTHSGQTTVGCERAIAYLKACDGEISRALRSDFDNKVDEHKAEALREKIWDMIDKLEEALADMMEKKSKKRKKAASIRVAKDVVARIKDGQDIQYYVEVSQGANTELLPVSLAEPADDQVQLFVKGEAQGEMTKEAATQKAMLYVDPWMHAVARILMNAHVSAGRNIEEVYAGLKEKYAFQPREELGIQEILLQNGMPIVKDFGRTGEKGGWESDGFGIEAPTTFYA